MYSTGMRVSGSHKRQRESSKRARIDENLGRERTSVRTREKLMEVRRRRISRLLLPFMGSGKKTRLITWARRRFNTAFGAAHAYACLLRQGGGLKLQRSSLSRCVSRSPRIRSASARCAAGSCSERASPAAAVSRHAAASSTPSRRRLRRRRRRRSGCTRVGGTPSAAAPSTLRPAPRGSVQLESYGTTCDSTGPLNYMYGPDLLLVIFSLGLIAPFAPTEVCPLYLLRARACRDRAIPAVHRSR